ncbi:ribonuclease D [Rothia kristinae]|uniref:ribonuclease D n=1 Tax=Rothia kristinae TaxID=37923 RepID=UPI0021A8AF2E|nr:HRDC domain-containing protein [Rothia kristinae]MCT1358109.1 HRDC domain-containing protein [Rothia kristinae]MCT1393892.1 HRDC domain-containing protein [Rothia kristinae]MCT1505219.1 HRDC domain-containing protein [Rothia kristinae]MCT2039396.1 HRDC domain-containing protein [Rothia kristinae]MCT2244018.1 HRDC domain-containing protein [Rothia kristinae]
MSEATASVPSASSPATPDPGQLGLDPTLSIPEVVPLDSPHDGVPRVIDTPEGLARAARMLTEATGPVAIDTERASGIRYGQRPFLVQLKRGDSPILLVDPEAFPDLLPLQEALRGVEWIIHAATQDLPSLRQVGMAPDALFDTELAGRLLGYAHVGLGAMTEDLLGYHLAKEHSAADWSTRPLPESWLVYAALDVELLADLREAVIAQLDTQGKLEWARQEFAHEIEQAAHPAPAKDPWRRTKGLRQLRTRRQLTALRNLWTEREKLAEAKDIAPKRLMKDSVLIAGAKAMPRSVPALVQIPGFHTKLIKREAVRWVSAIQEAAQDPDPVPMTVPSDTPPPIKAWEPKRPRSLALLTASRARLAELAEQTGTPVENLLTPDHLRRLCWDHAQEDPGQLGAQLEQLGARPWQIQLCAAPLAEVWADTPA